MPFFLQCSRRNSSSSSSVPESGAGLGSQEAATAALLKWGYFTDNQRFVKAPVSGQMKGLLLRGETVGVFFFFFSPSSVQDLHLRPSPLSLSLYSSMPVRPTGSLSVIIYTTGSHCQLPVIFRPNFCLPSWHPFFSLYFSMLSSCSSYVMLEHSPTLVIAGSSIAIEVNVLIVNM